MAKKIDWGRRYGADFCTPRGRRLTMYRKGQRVRFYDKQGRRVGPEQSNVAPAVAYADYKGWNICRRRNPGR